MNKKRVIFLLLFLMIAVPSYAVDILDRLVCKQDILQSNKTPVMVNRLTGEVKYIFRGNAGWILLTGKWKDQYQKMYDWQAAHAKH